MILRQLAERFERQSPFAVMFRAILERTFAAERLDEREKGPGPFSFRPLFFSNDPVMGRYDAIGTLARVNSTRPNAPKYALTEGKTVLAFITPGPGVDLDAYVKQQVGVIGQKGYIPELKASHITATTIGPTDPATIARMRADQKFR